MYFKYPELLYALVLLVIPVLVHLFQLRKFRTTQFTNVKFLKKTVLQTRKSSRLKKFLTLCTRLLLLTCLIIAFAQPYFPPASGEIKDTETVVYLDDSYSMQARGKSGVLLRRSVQDLLENIPEEEIITLFTNDEEYQNISVASLRERLQDRNFSPKELSWRAIELKARNFFRNSSDSQRNFIAISDFQHVEDSLTALGDDINTFLVQLRPENENNVALDSAWVTSRGLDVTVLNVSFSAYGDRQEEVAIGLYDGDRMLARKTVTLDEGLRGNTTFNLAADAIPHGRIEVEDNGLQFDNRFFFSINEIAPVNIVAIGDSEADYLQRIYSSPEFNLSILPENNIDFNLLSQANVIILNQPQKIPFSMLTLLQELVKEQVLLVIVPSVEAEIGDYNALLKNLDLPVFTALNTQEKLITDIIFEHPLYSSVFNEKVSNFEYPKVQSSYLLSKTTTGILKYQSGQPFLFEQDNVFVFTAALNQENSNFKNSPLIVPTFYNIGNLAISRPSLYSVLGDSHTIGIQANLQKDEILKLSSSETTFIPQQQSFQNKVEILLDELPKEPGHYDVLQEEKVLRSLSFNVSRSESDPVNTELNEREGIFVHSSVPEVFSEIKSANEVDSLWKWFVIFTLFFLITEIFILKFLK
ncbi:BatA domain-containing protein [Salinimicrobium sp. TH3]|uniref:BatA domain-containing protein n=1 Tax=Salinimicrobium sp. TH3 TaxID=2997342 RepID=UPI002274445D|nr:BatA domain-containing protein [Salinimicrobium sp. TH3]MCY2687101.1 BatA domain-containing protein [Salinimicrobium sp. TH3]